MTPTIYSELKEGSKFSSRMSKRSPTPSLFATVTSSSVVSTTTNVGIKCPTISSALNVSNNNVGSRALIQSNRRRMEEDFCEIPNKRQRRRQLSTTSSSNLSSTSTNCIDSGDGYGTDNELITINKNKDDLSCKCSTLDSLTDYEDDGYHNAIDEICVNRVSSSISPINFTTNSSSNSNAYIANHFNQRQILNVHKLNKLLSSDHYENIMERVTRTTEKITNASTKNLFDITIRTIKLIKRNQELHTKLSQLQSDTKTFFKSIMENPENQMLRNQYKAIEK